MSFPFLARLLALAMVPVLLTHSVIVHAQVSSDRFEMTVAA